MTNTKQPGTIGAAVAHNAHYEVGDPVQVNLPATTGWTVAYVSRVWPNGRYLTVTTFDGRGGIVRDVCSGEIRNI